MVGFLGEKAQILHTWKTRVYIYIYDSLKINTIEVKRRFFPVTNSLLFFRQLQDLVVPSSAQTFALEVPGKMRDGHPWGCPAVGS